MAKLSAMDLVEAEAKEASDEIFQAKFETVMKVKEAVEAAGVVFRIDENGLIHGVSLRQNG